MKTKQQTLWLLAALAAPAAHFSGSGWVMSLAAAAAVLPLTRIPKAWDGLSKPMAALQTVWLGAVTGMLLPAAAAYWPSDNDLAVPLTVLALAAVTNAAAAPRVGAVLALCMGLLAIPGAVSGAAHLEPGWLRGWVAPWSWGLTLALLLTNLPAGGGGKRNAVYAGILAAALSALVQGTISAGVAASVSDPFYQTARTLGYLEPVISAAMTLGWYAMADYLLQSARIIASGSGMRDMWATVLAVGTAAGAVLIKVQPERPVWALLALFFWVLHPFLMKIKKDEKT